MWKEPTSTLGNSSTAVTACPSFHSRIISVPKSGGLTSIASFPPSSGCSSPSLGATRAGSRCALLSPVPVRSRAPRGVQRHVIRPVTDRTLHSDCVACLHRESCGESDTVVLDINARNRVGAGSQACTQIMFQRGPISSTCFCHFGCDHKKLRLKRHHERLAIPSSERNHSKPPVF